MGYVYGVDGGYTIFLADFSGEHQDEPSNLGYYWYYYFQTKPDGD